MPELPPNRAHTIDIDTTGEVATFILSRTSHADTDERLIELFIDSDAAASYAVEFGGVRAEAFSKRTLEEGDVAWFADPEYVYPNTTSESRSWYQAAERLRVLVTSAAPGGSTADLYVTEGT